MIDSDGAQNIIWNRGRDRRGRKEKNDQRLPERKMQVY